MGIEKKHYKLSIGSRPGWPGSKVQNYLTHAVYKIENVNAFTKVKVMGYAKPNKIGLMAEDSVEGAKYIWLGSLLLQKTYIDIFENEIQTYAASMNYTGVGENCYTPIVRGLIAVKEAQKVNGVFKKNILKTEALLSKLLGTNYGMGVKVDNKMLLTGLVLFTGAFTWGITQYA
jgi:hypothetical protein